MNTKTLRVDSTNPDPVAIAHAAELLRAGRLVAFPTETVYGLGANALDPAAVRSIYTAKGRPGTNPLIVHVAEPAQVLNVAAAWPETAQRLAAVFWPGPLTIVVPKAAHVPAEVAAGGPTVAVRCPNHPVARALIAAAGVPVAAPSANRSTELSPTRAEHVIKGLNGLIDLVLDGGACPGGIESTVVDVTGDTVRLLRLGLIPVAMLEHVVGELATHGNRELADFVARAPGQMAKHYSPRTPLRLVADADLEAEFITACHAGKKCGLLRLPDNPELAATMLYDTLHDMDESGFDLILAELPPNTPAWAAVRDRLMRAAAIGCA